ncbi:MAG: iron ABC transporter permease [Planctomycetes bacterium]|nr:iron ABC transporter permease [Planctomycetota bacterium]
MSALTRGRFFGALLITAAFTAAVFAVAPMIGRTWIPWTATGVDADIFARLRLPRVVLGLLAGGTLALCGASMQTLLRNPLASEYTLGISGGAAFAALLAGETVLASVPGGLQAAGLAGGLLSLVVVWSLARRRGGLPPGELILTGVTLSLIFSALTLVALNRISSTRALQVVRWLAGGLETTGYDAVRQAAPWCAAAAALLLASARDLHQVAAGEDLAASRGVSVPRTQLLAFLGASLGTAAVVSVCGPIGFVGLIVPHAVRLVAGPDARLALPLSALAGAGFLALADAAARALSSPQELPVGVVTAMLGGPFFLWLLRTRNRV